MNKNVLITGANHGLGLSLVKFMIEQRYTVFAGVYKLSEEAQISGLKGTENLYLVDIDVGSTESVTNAAATISTYTKSLDIIINNAGVLCNDSLTGADNTLDLS